MRGHSMISSSQRYLFSSVCIACLVMGADASGPDKGPAVEEQPSKSSNRRSVQQFPFEFVDGTGEAKPASGEP